MSAAHTVPHTRILLGLVVGAALGCAVNALKAEGVIGGEFVAGLIKYVTKPVGDIFLNLLFMAIIPLVFASIEANRDGHRDRRGAAVSMRLYRDYTPGVVLRGHRHAILGQLHALATCTGLE